MIEPTVPPGPPEQAAQTSSGGDQALELAANLVIEGAAEAVTQSGDLVGGAVVAGAEVVGSLFGSLFESL